MRVLHVEVGGRYGGSLRALETYLAHSRHPDLEHELLLYHPTPGSGALQTYLGRLRTLYDFPLEELSGRAGPKSRWRKKLKAATPAGLRDLARLLSLATEYPTVRRLARELRAGGYSAVHVNNTFTYQPLTLWAAKLVGVPLIAHARNPVPAGLFARRMMRLTCSVVTVNRGLQRELKSWGLPVEVHVCYDGVVAEAPDETCASKLRASLVEPGGILVGSVGRFDEQKGYHDLVRAAREVVDAHPEARFAVAADGPLRPALEKLIADLNLSDRFHLCGFQQDVASFLAALDLFVCPSHWEGGPMVVIEALLLGKPVVTTEVGFTAELVVPGRNGYLVPPGNPEALARAMMDSFRNLSALTRGACEGRPQAASLTDPDRSARVFDRLLQAVVRGH